MSPLQTLSSRAGRSPFGGTRTNRRRRSSTRRGVSLIEEACLPNNSYRSYDLPQSPNNLNRPPPSTRSPDAAARRGPRRNGRRNLQ